MRYQLIAHTETFTNGAHIMILHIVAYALLAWIGYKMIRGLLSCAD